MGNSLSQALIEDVDDEEMNWWESDGSSSDPVVGMVVAGALVVVTILLAVRAWKFLSQLLSSDAAADTDQDEAVMSGTETVKSDRVDSGGYHQFEDFQRPSSRNRRELHSSPYLSGTGKVKSDRVDFGGYNQFDDFIQKPSPTNRGELYASPSYLSGIERVKNGDRADCGGYRKRAEDFIQTSSLRNQQGEVYASPDVSGTGRVKSDRADCGGYLQLEELIQRLSAELNQRLSSGIPEEQYASPYIPSVPKTRSRQKPIKVLSYNVWSREDVNVTERMRAIGNFIEKRSPELICFQEVTPNIYEIFRSSKWWKAYSCSVSAERASRRAPFSMQMSKLSAKFDCVNLVVSNMERELCMAVVKVGKAKKLVFAASHLVSPKPHQNLTYSTERVAQARKALSHLKNYSNVVFGGDMNWDEEVDGSFPLPDGWVDAWEVLRPGKKGWTFDTKANKMLSDKRLLQKRLDRFLCCLTDFSISHIEMIGKEAIPEISSRRKKVLPSDHFGLLLTIHRL